MGVVALVALDLGILVASHLGIQQHRQVISRASFDSFRFFALEWLQGWFFEYRNEQLMEYLSCCGVHLTESRSSTDIESQPQVILS